MTTDQSVTNLVAMLIYVIVSAFIWVPIGFLAAQVNIKLTLIILGMLMIKQVSKMYMGIK